MGRFGSKTEYKMSNMDKRLISSRLEKLKNNRSLLIKMKKDKFVRQRIKDVEQAISNLKNWLKEI